jgi:hypothetical protein
VNKQIELISRRGREEIIYDPTQIHRWRWLPWRNAIRKMVMREEASPENEMVGIESNAINNKTLSGK